MSRFNPNLVISNLIRIAASAGVFAMLAGCASWYGKSSDPDANRHAACADSGDGRRHAPRLAHAGPVSFDDAIRRKAEPAHWRSAGTGV